MRVSDQRIRAWLGADEKEDYGESRLWKTIQESKQAFYEYEADGMLSRAEFLYQQSRYIQKRWWLLQGGTLLLLWKLMKWAGSGFFVQRGMGVAASLFAVLLLPELWKNRSADAMEVECAACYSLRQIYAARIFLSALVDFLLLGIFCTAALITGRMLAEDLIVQFFLPYFVTCCICFGALYSRRVRLSEVSALFLCMVWCAVWMQQVLMNETLYAAVCSVWPAEMAAAVGYLGWCIHRGQKNCREMWEERRIWN